jgi:hypothetical protein
MTYPKWPSEFALRRNNQRLIAERLGRPDGVLQACWELEDRHPGWEVSWLPESATPGFERPAGFYASCRTGAHAVGVLKAYAPTAAELEPLLEEVPKHDYGAGGCGWCRARMWQS